MVGFDPEIRGLNKMFLTAPTLDLTHNIKTVFFVNFPKGNILVKRFSRAPVFVLNTLEESAVSNDVIRLAPRGELEAERPFKIFDMKKFQQNVNRELKRPFPDRRKVGGGLIN